MELFGTVARCLRDSGNAHDVVLDNLDEAVPFGGCHGKGAFSCAGLVAYRHGDSWWCHDNDDRAQHKTYQVCRLPFALEGCILKCRTFSC